ncbi:hypothetical protein [Aquimarina mytili]|uniref:Uncharacterized protein n=1 Tax=Aquimarina mytili TaxID=874423 RepID=A0A937DC53_9FLAO|nr:hypothetical protein [Aquimarina mytili]MBL0684566.1 hypothetical protein [Aquimarina mytili]
MSKEANIIVHEIEKYLTGCSGKDYSNYYVGVTKDPLKRLFIEHNVPQEDGCWTYEKAIDSDNAREAEKILLSKGMKGGDGGGDTTSMFVYCYLIPT